MKRLFLLVIVLCGVSAFGQDYQCVGFDGPAQCPNFMSSFYRTYPIQNSANIFNVTAGSAIDLQAKINSAAAACGSTGAIVNVPSGNTYLTSSYYNLPPTNCDATHWVVIQSDHLSSLPAQGTRVSAANRSNMPLLTSTTGLQTNHAIILAADNPATPLNAAGGACTATGGGASTVPCGYWLAGLDVEDQADESGNGNAAILNLGEYCQLIGGGGCPITSGMTINNIASRFTVDRCYIAGPSDTPSFGIANGITYTASYLTVRDSAIQHIITISAESHGMVSSFSFGPVDIYNNLIEASSINVFFGSTDPTIPGEQPSDLYVHQNYLHKVNAWVTSSAASAGYDTKDVLESKNSTRLLAEGNVLGPSYDTGQNYVSFQLSPRNANGNCSWCAVTDSIFRYNQSLGVTGFFSILGVNQSPCEHLNDTHCDNVLPCPGSCYFTVASLPTKRASVHDNIAENVTGPMLKLHIGGPHGGLVLGTVCPSTGNGCRVSDISVAHNTLASITTLSPVPPGAPQAMVDLIYSEGSGDAPQNDAGYNITIRDNVMPCSNQGSGGCMVNDFGIQTSANCTQPTQTCGLAKGFNAYFISPGGNAPNGIPNYGWIFTGNVIPFVTAEGFVASNIPVQNSDNSAANNFASNLPAAYTNVGFVNWNSGTGGDYHLCFGNGVPAGCTTNSAYQDQASDSFNDVTREGPNSGANIDAVNQMTANVTTGVYTIQPVRAYGPVQGQFQEMRQWVKFPGYYDAGVSDGSGLPTLLGKKYSGNNSQGFAGIYPFHDLQHDPGGLMQLSGTNVGLFDHDYCAGTVCSGTSQPCGFGNAVSDSKASWGQVSVLSSNNVRTLAKYRGPFIATSTSAPVDNSQLFMWNYVYAFYRPGFVNTRYSVDNNCGSAVAFQIFEPRMTSTVYTFDKIPGADQYPPSFGRGWDDNAWQSAGCGKGSVNYDPGTAFPWGALKGTGWMMHSITSTTATGTFVGGLTDGFTQRNCSGSVPLLPNGNPDTNQYPVTAEFLNVLGDAFSTATGGSYSVAFAGGGGRTDLNSGGLTIQPNGVDSAVMHSCGWYGALLILNSANAGELAAECQTPVAPTMNAGSSPSFNRDYGVWSMTADGSPKVDFTLNHEWTSPVLAISGWNGSAPTVRVNGVVQTANVNYVFSTNDGSGDPVSNGASGLLVQLVGLPTNGSGGMVTLPSGAHIVITSGNAPIIPLPYIGHQTIFHKGNER